MDASITIKSRIAGLFIAIAAILIIGLACVACSSSDPNDKYTFGTDDMGYLTPSQKYDFDLATQGFLIFTSENRDSLVMMTSMTSYAESAANLSADSVNEQLASMYESLILSYSGSGTYYDIEEFTSDNGVEGTLFVGNANRSTSSIAYADLINEVIDNTPDVSNVLFVTSDCKIVCVIANEETAKNLISTYSYEGTPAVVLTEDIVNQKKN